MASLVWLVLVALALKLFWNLAVPYVLLRQLRVSRTAATQRISMTTAIEIILLLIATGVSALSNGASWVNRPPLVGGYGVGAVVFTYVHLAVVGFIGGWVVTRGKRTSGRG